jgi:hypothetical protein
MKNPKGRDSKVAENATLTENSMAWYSDRESVSILFITI